MLPEYPPPLYFVSAAPAWIQPLSPLTQPAMSNQVKCNKEWLSSLAGLQYLSKALTTSTLFDLAILLLGVFPKEWFQDVHTDLFIVAHKESSFQYYLE